MRRYGAWTIVLVVAVSGPWALEASDSDFSFDASDFSLSAGRLYDDGAAVPEARTLSAEPDVAATGVGGSSSLFSGIVPLTLGASDDVLGTYFAARVGPVWYLGDFDELDVGLWAEGAFGLRLIKILALELQAGYYYGDFDGGGVPDRGKLWGVPLTVNAKLTIPILIFDLYGGVGVGAYYVDTEVNALGRRFDKDDWAFGGQAFLGLLLELGGIGLGVEGRYFVTEEVSVAGGGKGNFEGAALLATLQLGF